jgi:hypothetical protein
MRIRRRHAIVLALAAAAAVAAAGIAAAAPDGNSSTLDVQVIPSTLPKTTYKPAKLFTHVSTKSAHPGLKPQGGFVRKTQIWYDDDGRINANAVPVCNKNLANTTMAQAMTLCGKAKVGTGTAVATSTQNANIPACVLVFNGPKQAGNPTVLLHTRIQGKNCSSPAGNNSGALTVLLTGVIKPATGDFGNMLEVDKIDTQPLPLKDFQATVGGGGTRYITARCNDADHLLNGKAKFTYSDGQSDTVKDSMRCQVG